MKGGVHFSIDINPMPCIYLFNIDFEFDFLSHTSHTHLEFNLNIYAEILDFLLIVDFFSRYRVSRKRRRFSTLNNVYDLLLIDRKGKINENIDFSIFQQ